VVDARFSYKGEDVVQTLERTCRQVGYPAVMRVDNGSEFISRDLELWAYHKGVVLDISRPGKPTDNSFIESFNSKFRAECLNAHWSMSPRCCKATADDDARVKMEVWRRDYNEFRPHSAIGNKVPISLMNGLSAPPPTRAMTPKNSSSRWPKIGEHVIDGPELTSKWMISTGQDHRRHCWRAVASQTL
jgi:putative transposase